MSSSGTCTFPELAGLRRQIPAQAAIPNRESAGIVPVVGARPFAGTPGFRVRESVSVYIRSAVAGSTWALRRAGHQLASKPAAMITVTAMPIAAGLCGATSNTNVVSSRADASAASTPQAIPMRTGRIPVVSTSRASAAGRAPSALRIPISRWRRAAT
jgi:hypothetical protein